MTNTNYYLLRFYDVSDMMVSTPITANSHNDFTIKYYYLHFSTEETDLGRFNILSLKLMLVCNMNVFFKLENKIHRIITIN